MSLSRILEKADAAAKSARLLLAAELFDDAVNRAYYAMFDCARAFLLVKAGVNPGDIRKHAGVVSRFSKEAVLTGMLDAEHGRALARALDDRLVADYTERRMDAEEARILIAKMDGFLAAVGSVLKDEGGRP